MFDEDDKIAGMVEFIKGTRGAQSRTDLEITITRPLFSVFLEKHVETEGVPADRSTVVRVEQNSADGTSRVDEGLPGVLHSVLWVRFLQERA